MLPGVVTQPRLCLVLVSVMDWSHLLVVVVLHVIVRQLLLLVVMYIIALSHCIATSAILDSKCLPLLKLLLEPD